MTILKTIKSTAGNSLAEFAVVIALMATLMSTGQVKFSQAGEGGKGKKSGEEMDKIAKAANNFYNAMNEEESAGRFPGQEKWDKNVPGDETAPNGSGMDANGDAVAAGGKGYSSIEAAEAAVDAWTSYNSATTAAQGSNWVSVFGKATTNYAIDSEHTDKISADDGGTNIGKNEFGDYVDPVASPFLDGHFIYTVVGGTTEHSPAMIVTDFYAAADEFVVVEP